MRFSCDFPWIQKRKGSLNNRNLETPMLSLALFAAIDVNCTSLNGWVTWRKEDADKLLRNPGVSTCILAGWAWAPPTRFETPFSAAKYVSLFELPLIVATKCPPNSLSKWLIRTTRTLWYFSYSCNAFPAKTRTFIEFAEESGNNSQVKVQFNTHWECVVCSWHLQDELVKATKASHINPFHTNFDTSFRSFEYRLHSTVFGVFENCQTLKFPF